MMEDTVEEVFREAESFIRKNFPEDLRWSEDLVNNVHLSMITKAQFMQEYAYVVYCSGYKQSIVRRHWDALCDVYRYFSPSSMTRYVEIIREKALKHIANKKKIDAILRVAQKIHPMNKTKWQDFKAKVKEEDSFAALEELPFIGPITKYHFARNIGFNVIKPDVHLQRMADHFGLSPFEMCRILSEKSQQLTGRHYPEHTIDTILWRTSAEGVIKFSDRKADT